MSWDATLHAACCGTQLPGQWNYTYNTTPMVDADTVCETLRPICNRIGPNFGKPDHSGCPDCINGRRPLRDGDRIAIRAGAAVNDRKTGEWTERFVTPKFGIVFEPMWLAIRDGADEMESFVLRPGEVVGHATVADVLPIVDGQGACGSSFDDSQPHICWWGDSSHTCAYDGEDDIDISDHLDAGLVFTPGGVALDLNVETTG